MHTTSFFIAGRAFDPVAHAAASDAKSQAADAASRIREVEERLDRALLACEAMYSFVRDKLGVTDEQMAERINDIDLSDGVLDGKVRRTAVSCPKCNRTISPRFTKCMYCGQPIMRAPFA